MLEMNTTRMLQFLGTTLVVALMFLLIAWLFKGGTNPSDGKKGENIDKTYHDYQNDKRDAMTILNTIAEVK